nr:pistil-specific extensin-like protein [Aegilops tauschii subsp. strangulata]XP_045084394.1 pistil-specific extensin-like protein [Aegilops tauschii subsp. strangulata]
MTPTLSLVYLPLSRWIGSGTGPISFPSRRSPRGRRRRPAPPLADSSSPLLSLVRRPAEAAASPHRRPDAIRRRCHLAPVVNLPRRTTPSPLTVPTTSLSAPPPPCAFPSSDTSSCMSSPPSVALATARIAARMPPLHFHLLLSRTGSPQHFRGELPPPPLPPPRSSPAPAPVTRAPRSPPALLTPLPHLHARSRSPRGDRARLRTRVPPIPLCRARCYSDAPQPPRSPAAPAHCTARPRRHRCAVLPRL